MFIFKKKYPRVEDAENEKDDDSFNQESQEEKKPDMPATTDRVTQALSADIIKLKAQFDQFAELERLLGAQAVDEGFEEHRGLRVEGVLSKLRLPAGQVSCEHFAQRRLNRCRRR